MDSPASDDECRHCLTQRVIGQFMLEKDVLQLFHEPCRECDEAATESLVTLCDRCQHLRPRHFLSGCSQTLEYLNPKIILSFELSLGDLETCALCRFMASVAREEYWADLSDMEIQFGRGGMCGVSWARVHHRYFDADRSDENLLHVREYIEWDLLRHQMEVWDEAAESKHDANTMLQAPQGVQVIDVTQACIVRLPPKSTYAALSYVWGGDTGDQAQATTGNMPFLRQRGSLESIALPCTISDALVVCKNLGIFYLWVDRLSICQNDTSDDKTYQLNQMGAIYNRASVTIVAAAGGGASYGLPGISRPRTGIQRALTVASGMP
jgi:hypothetical protein